jgi:hypothetical protein
VSRRSRSRRIPIVSGESASSKAYTAGRTVGYRGRIRGPTFPVKTFSIDDLPDDSVLKPFAQAMRDFANDPINDITEEGS